MELDEVDWFKVAHLVTDCTKKGLVLIAVDEENNILGTIGGALMAEWYSSVPVLGDYWFYVLPEHRDTPAAFKLVKVFKDIAKKAGVAMKMGHTLGDDERKDKLYEKLGFTKSGCLFRRESENGRVMQAKR